MITEPIVSVCMITYNHELYICEAIEGVLMQKVDFPIELIIGEDCSTDNTRKIVKEYESLYPDIIVAQYPEQNRGMMKNFLTVLQSARGKYIALCEGDDYWTDPLKLQKQVDFLEANDNFSVCFHKIKIRKENRLFKDFITNVPKGESTINDILIGNYIHTPSVMFRNGLIKEFPEWYLISPVGDHPLYILLAQYGKLKYIEETMAVYRIHKNGVWSQRDKQNIEVLKRSIESQKLMIDDFECDIKMILKNNISLLMLDLSEIYFKKNMYELSLQLFNESTLYSIETLHSKYFKYKLFGEKLKIIFNKVLLPNSIKNKLIKQFTK